MYVGAVELYSSFSIQTNVIIELVHFNSITALQ